MLRFAFNRIEIAIREHFSWFLVPLIVTLAFLAISYLRADRYVVSTVVPVPAATSQQAASGGDAKSYILSAAGVGTYARETLGADAFFGAQAFYAYVLSQREAEDLGIRFSGRMEGMQWRESEPVHAVVRNLTLAFQNDNHALRLRYEGSQRELGVKVVETLASRMGAHLSGFAVKPGEAQTPQPVEVLAVRFQLPDGVLVVALLLFIIGMCLTLAFVSVVEMSSRTLSSVTQVAKYLGVPVMGMVPRVSGGRAASVSNPANPTPPQPNV